MQKGRAARREGSDGCHDWLAGHDDAAVHAAAAGCAVDAAVDGAAPAAEVASRTVTAAHLP